MTLTRSGIRDDPAGAGDAEHMSRFEREARLLASLHHPDVAAAHGLESFDGIRGLAMEIIPVDDLSIRRTNRGFDWPVRCT